MIDTTGKIRKLTWSESYAGEQRVDLGHAAQRFLVDRYRPRAGAGGEALVGLTVRTAVASSTRVQQVLEGVVEDSGLEFILTRTWVPALGVTKVLGYALEPV